MSTGATIEFEDQFSSTGRLIVARDNDGNLGFSLSDSIAAQGSDRSLAIAGKPLDELYRALHPQNDVPIRLRALANEFEHGRSPKADAPSQAGERGVNELQATMDKNLSTFNSTVCKNLPYDGSWLYYWRKIACDFDLHPGSPPAVTCYNTGDISYAWNETPEGAYHTNSNSTWKPIIPAYYYSWTQWNMNYQCAVVELYPTNPAHRADGYYGVTDHRKTSQAQVCPGC